MRFKAIKAASLCLMLAACGQDSEGDVGPTLDAGVDANTEDAGGGRADTDLDANDAGTSAECFGGHPSISSTGPLGEALRETRTVDERSYEVFVPAGLDTSRPVPLVLNFHGATPDVVDASQAQALISEFDAFATAEGFIAVYPQSLSFGGTQFWQSDADSEDVAFVDALLSEVSAAFCVDRERIYSTGFSSGALMSYTLACVRSEVFAAVAPVAGLVGVDGCEPASPVGLIAFNGTADARIDHSAGAESAEAFAARAGCDPDPVETFREGDASCVTYAGCRPGQEVEFCTIDEGGHTWPGSEGSERILSNFGEGKTSTDLNANAKMWAFFEALSL